MSQATWADPTATWASLDYAWDGTLLGAVTATPGGLGRRGPYRPLPDLELEDEEILILL